MKPTTLEKVFNEIYAAIGRQLHEDAEIHYRLFGDGVQITVRVPGFGSKMEDCYTTGTIAWKTLMDPGEANPLAMGVVDMCRQTNIGLGKVRYEDWVSWGGKSWDDLPDAAKNPWMAREFNQEQAIQITEAVLVR